MTLFIVKEFRHTNLKANQWANQQYYDNVSSAGFKRIFNPCFISLNKTTHKNVAYLLHVEQNFILQTILWLNMNIQHQTNARFTRQFHCYLNETPKHEYEFCMFNEKTSTRALVSVHFEPSWPPHCLFSVCMQMENTSGKCSPLGQLEKFYNWI